ncbi:diaminopimelate decarboxylase [Streptomyces zhaozhouensis]|uniref:Diaminopimelate decarboxylase n=1 Tax=Streptomyces zhaozhouensis TaxID=1300267 RepID=A0A286DWF9_9ACTN|nr:Y4yA family PLP-dependent enzyme [Streptomyces zhaozhouensis]SOD62963.1 diaminopimelate decarboxylase [Streptomyces zhaozhouensis]
MGAPLSQDQGLVGSAASEDGSGAAPEEPLFLEPRLEPPLRALLAAPDLLHELVDALGSPLNVVLPEVVASNVEAFRAVYRRHRLQGRICFAHKANASSALVRRLADTEAGLDAASVAELSHALGAGFAPDRVVATGPKDPDFLWLAARAGVTVHVDAPAELADLVRLVRARGLPRVRVLLRLSGFASEGVRLLTRRTRFGTPAGAVGELLDLCARERDAVELLGVGYHLDTTGLEEKALALESCVLVLDEARARGLDPRVVDVGGGFGASYLADGRQWERYTTALTDAVLGRRPPLTWGGHGYGLRNEGGTVRGRLTLYPAHRPVAGPGYLDELLNTPAPGLGRPLAEVLLEHLYDLWVEPGRSLVDQCGLSLARVVDVRATEDGTRLVRLAMTAGDVSLEEHGVLTDPVLVPRAGAADPPGDGDDRPVGVHLVGDLCLESDLVTRRTVFLPRLPDRGDLLAFANTAGYCMDFRAHRAQMRPGARKVAAGRRPDGAWWWSLDERYWPHTTRRSGES